MYERSPHENSKMTEPSSSKAVALQAMDIVINVMRRIESPQDLLSASAVCKTWRTAAEDPSQLRSWVLDDTPSCSAVGVKVSVTSLLPKTPPPRQWINPATDSPFASFKTPRSIMRLKTPSKFGVVESGLGRQDEGGSVGVGVGDDGGPSPKTPSPLQQPMAQVASLKRVICHKMVMGRYLGDIDICSSRLTDECLQIITKSCPRLHTLRLLHICDAKQTAAPDALFFPNRKEVVSDRNASHLLTSCGCGHLSEKGFLNISQHCPNLMSVTLVLQHILLRKVLQDIFMELGKLIKLQTLSIDLRMPSFGQSLKSEVIWESHLRCTDKEVLALLAAGQPPLNALALNRCDLTELSLDALTKACPNIEAIDLHSHFQIPTEHGLNSLVPLRLKDLTSLSAAAFGVIHDLEGCEFGAWQFHYLKRLRLESREPLAIKHLEDLQQSCPQLESLHLIWHSYNGPREAHIYPFTHEGIMDYVKSVFL
ncbi:hypothetical protein SUGI_0021160 [Cryptomeria japonica]|uniref:uncharacterized protein LOC131029005 n=1 Tax=Cryptomeria japonica TaxID=3369 RepID=UPI002408E34F|nr:uncharacterized protein LOC131029005 [Cryptomeria japonica]GLJ05612.1 hypothetical protein SUGI_0021160 [Cryptomeria japonica]